MGFLLRTVLWLGLVAMFLPPDERPFELPFLTLPPDLNLRPAAAGPPPDLCPKGTASCRALQQALDAAVTDGVAGLETLEALLGDAKAQIPRAAR